MLRQRQRELLAEAERLATSTPPSVIDLARLLRDVIKDLPVDQPEPINPMSDRDHYPYVSR